MTNHYDQDSALVLFWQYKNQPHHEDPQKTITAVYLDRQIAHKKMEELQHDPLRLWQLTTVPLHP